MKTKWVPPARSHFLDVLAALKERNAQAASRAYGEAEDAVARLGRRPHLGRPSRWPGLREWSLLRWKKILVYRIEPEGIVIVAFYDARQDLGAVTPE